MYLVEVVVFLRFEKVEGLPLLFTGSSQQVIEDMVVPTKQSSILVTPGPPRLVEIRWLKGPASG